MVSHPDATIFHSSAWARVLAETYGHRPFYLQARYGPKTVMLLPLMEVASSITGRRGVSLPFSDFCQPLFFGEGDMGAMAPRLCKIAHSSHWSHLEFRENVDESNDARLPATFFGHKVDLSRGEGAVFSGFDSSVRRSIRKAERSGVVVEVSRTRGALEEYCELHCNTRRRHGAPPQPRRFFHEIEKRLFRTGLGFVSMARMRGRAIAGAVFLQWGDKALFKFGASEKSSQALRPNHLIMWESIRCLIRTNTALLHFGRTAVDNEGLRRFKLSWGTREEKIFYRHLMSETGCFEPMKSSSGPGFHHWLFRHSPLGLNRLAGKLIYPHLD